MTMVNIEKQTSSIKGILGSAFVSGQWYVFWDGSLYACVSRVYKNLDYDECTTLYLMHVKTGMLLDINEEVRYDATKVNDVKINYS